MKMSDGFQLFLRRWPSNGIAKRMIVFLHGIEVHSGAFRTLGPVLSDQAEMYAFDRRGFGNSKEDGLPRGDTRSFSRHMADMGEVVESARKDNPGTKVILFGHSIGCAYALWYAANGGTPIDGMILAAPPVTPGFKVPARDAIKFPFLKLLKPHAVYDLLDKWPQAFKESEEFKLLAGDDLCTRKFGIGWLLDVQTKLANKMLPNASRFSQPVLVIQGDADIIALPVGSKRLMERLASKDKTMRMFEGADHWFYHAIIPTVGPRYDPQKRKMVSDAVGEWLSAH